MSTGGMSTRPHASSVDARVTFRVLGPLEVRVGTSPLQVRGPQERAVLALLLTAPGRVFSVRAIAAGLWGERPPGGADNTVMSYVSRLRRGMPDGVATTVVTRRPGYLVEIEPDQVDAERFRSLVRRGRRELDSARPERAAGSLREALSLWRGDAFAEFDAPFAVAERRILEELRLTALEDRLSADLELGGGPDLVAELESLVSAHPLRERLWAQLMTALYRSGRQGDSLQSYQRARASLVGELGVEPGDELQELHAMVLGHDQRLVKPSAGSARRWPVATSGPAFVGRTRELELLEEAFRRAAAGSTVRMLITGAHGMGKSRVLGELARHVQAAGGSVVDEPAGLGAATGAVPTLLVLDDLQRYPAADLVRLSEVLTAEGRPLLVVAACALDEVSPERAAVIDDLFSDRLPLAPLGAGEIRQLMELYLPSSAVVEALEAPEVVASAGIPLHLHAAASRYGERLLADRIVRGAEEIPDPRRRLAQSRAQVADGVAGLARLRSFRQGRLGADTGRRVCPFKGLAFYDVDDAPYFAGREHLVARLVARLVDAPLLAVVGASGSGKSSVVRAGLVAAVREGLLPGSLRWRVVVTTPGRQAPGLPPAGEPDRGPRTLLVVDQLEEMYTLLTTDAQSAYAEWLTAAAGRDDVSVVVAIRSDYFARVVAHRRLADLVAANTVLVGAMSDVELRQAVEVPAAAADLRIDPGLSTAIAQDVVGEAGGLPLMSTALLSLWERGDGRHLSLTDYRETGGVRTAVASLAETAYTPMTPVQRTHARRILLRLAEVDDAGEPIRRRVALTELAVDGDPDAEQALESLAAGRLLTVSSTHAEVAHEALLREWPRLRGWLDEDEAGRRLRRHLVPAAAAWQTSARDPGELYRGQRLTAALDFMAEHGGDLTTPERDFILAGRDAAEADAAAHRRTLRRLRALAAGLAVALVAALGAGWVAVDRRDELARLAVEADVRALRAAALSEDRWDLALLYAAQAYELDHSAESHAALLRTVHRSPEATAMYTTDRRLLALAVSADGRTLAGLSSAGTAYLWDLGTGRRTSTVPGLTEIEATSIDLSPDGRYLAVVGIPLDAERYNYRGQLIVVDLHQTPTPTPRTLEGPGITAARFTGDGRTVVTVGIHGQVQAVDVRTGRTARLGGVRLAISDDTAMDAPVGRRFMAAADPLAPGRVTAWEVDNGRVVWESEEGSGTVVSVSPAGTALVLAHRSGSVEHLDLVTGARRDVPSDPAVGLVDLDWAPDGTSFAGATTEGTVTLWDARTLEPRSELRGHSGTVSQVLHSADGESLYASGFDGTVVVWDLTGTRGIVREAGRPTPVVPFGFFRAANGVVAANGSVAASYSAHGVLSLVDVPAAVSSVVPLEMSGSPAQLVVDRSGRYAALLTVTYPAGLRAEIQVVDVASRRALPKRIQLLADFTSPAPAFSGDSRSLVTADLSDVLVWDVRAAEPAGGAAYVATESIRSIAPDATGRIVALGVVGGHVEVGDTTTGALVAELVPPGGEDLAVTPLSFSPDGRWLAGGSESGRVVVWDTATWEVANVWVAVQGGRVDSLAFTPDSSAVVAGGAGAASVWTVGAGSPAGMTLPLSALPSQSDVAVATLDGGRTVVTLTADEGVQRWAISPQALLEHACDVAGRNLTPDEWRFALPSLPYARTCEGR